MPEGLSATEVGQEIAAHAKHAGGHDQRDRLIVILEAILLSVVTLCAAWSGYAAAKWSTESRLSVAEASTARIEANRAEGETAALRNLDSSTFGAWFAAYIAGNEEAMRIAERRFRPEYKVAFDAWRATNPETNPNAPKGPGYMPQYREPGLTKRRALDAKASAAFVRGESQGATADKYVRTTVLLASVLFLVGISTHFPVRGARYGLIVVGAILLAFSLVQLAGLPVPDL